MDARQKDLRMFVALGRICDGIPGALTYANMARLRRAALTLSRWAEAECGDGSGWHIERDEATDIPYRVHDDTGSRYRIPDRERGALRTVAEIAAALGLHWYHQTDPRGLPVYLSAEPLTPENYHRGVGVA